MDERALLDAVTRAGLETDVAEDSWRDSVNLLAALDAIGRDGGNAMIKIDGARGRGNTYTVVLSGGRLHEDFFRKDGAELPELLRDAISFYVAHAVRPGE